MTKPNVHAVHRDWDRQFPVIERAEGIYLYDRDGKRYIDGSGGSSVVTTIGHGIQEVSLAMAEQARQFSFYPAHAFTNQPFLDLSDLVVSLAPGELKDKSRVLLLHCLSGGRSGIAKRQLKGMGYTNVFNLGSYGRAKQIVSGEDASSV